MDTLFKKLIFILAFIIATSTLSDALDFKTRYAHIEYVSPEAENYSIVVRVDKIIKRVYEILELKQDPSLIIKIMVYEDVEQVKTMYRTFKKNPSPKLDAISFTFPLSAVIYTYATVDDGILAHEITHILVHKAIDGITGNGKIAEIIPWYVERQIKEGR